MAAVKHTKNELKSQRDSLKRFVRYLPTLQLKKQQLQVELRTLEQKRDALIQADTSLLTELESWISLWSRPEKPETFVQLRNLEMGSGNIAGVTIPFLKSLEIQISPPDFEKTELWVDEAILALKKRIELDVQRRVVEAQWEKLSRELRITSQRVNLFEKVKIPEAKNNIRTIRIFLGDQQTAAVARAKIAKNKSSEATQ